MPSFMLPYGRLTPNSQVWVLKRKEDTNQHCEREHWQDSLRAKKLDESPGGDSPYQDSLRLK